MLTQNFQIGALGFGGQTFLYPISFLNAQYKILFAHKTVKVDNG